MNDKKSEALLKGDAQRGGYALTKETKPGSGKPQTLAPRDDEALKRIRKTYQRSVVALAIFFTLQAPVFASDPVMVDLLKKGAEAERLKEKMKHFGIKEKPGFKVIGVSEPYYLIDGVQVRCDQVEMKCANGKCVLVPKASK